MGKNIVIIPARGGSKGIPNKNIVDFLGKPLLQYAIDVAKESKYSDIIFVSTDSQEIATIAKDLGASVEPMRPPKIAEDTTPDFPVVDFVLRNYMEKGIDIENIIYLRPTNVFRLPFDIDLMIERINKEKFDSIRSVSLAPYPPYWMKKESNGHLVSFMETEYEYKRRQDLPEVLVGNGAIEVISVNCITKLKSMYGNKVGIYKMINRPWIDIDTPLDLEIAKIVYANWNKSGE